METKKDIEKTIYYIKKLKPNKVIPSVVVVFPGTELFQLLIKKYFISRDLG